MVGTVLVALTLVMVLYSVVARLLEHLQVSAPMVFLLSGLLLFSVVPGMEVTGAEVQLIAEMTLVVVLFHDASVVRVSMLRHSPGLPLRLLLIGFPIALAMTLGVSYWLVPSLGLAGALLLAGTLTPTDAGLGAATVLNPKVPRKIRRALNVESGTNDGLATPVVLLAIAMLSAEEGAEVPAFLQVSLPPTLLAVALASVVAFGVSWLMDESRSRRLSSVRGRALTVLVLPLLLWGAAGMIGANGFLAAFLGGLIFGARSACLAEDGEATELLETGADLLSYIVWFFAGGLLIAVITTGFDWRYLVLAVLVLTVLRMVPVAISLIGSGLPPTAVLFIGWFGPRGLATIVFALLAIEELGADDPTVRFVAAVAATTVILSVFAHGATAFPLALRFGRWCRRSRPELAHDGPSPTGSRGRHAFLPGGHEADPEVPDEPSGPAPG